MSWPPPLSRMANDGARSSSRWGGGVRVAFTWSRSADPGGTQGRVGRHRRTAVARARCVSIPVVSCGSGRVRDVAPAPHPFAPRVPLCRRGLRPPRPPAALILTPMPKDIVISRPASFDPATATRRRFAVPSALASPLFGRRIGRTEVHQATEQQCSPPLPRPHHARDSYLPADHVYAPHASRAGVSWTPPEASASTKSEQSDNWSGGGQRDPVGRIRWWPVLRSARELIRAPEPDPALQGGPDRVRSSWPGRALRRPSRTPTHSRTARPVARHRRQGSS